MLIFAEFTRPKVQRQNHLICDCCLPVRLRSNARFGRGFSAECGQGDEIEASWGKGATPNACCRKLRYLSSMHEEGGGRTYGVHSSMGSRWRLDMVWLFNASDCLAKLSLLTSLE